MQTGKYRKAGRYLLAALLACVLLMMIERSENAGIVGTEIENRLKTVLNSVAGVGSVNVLVNESQGGEIIGVCVVTPAAGDAAAVFRIQRAVRTALGIENDRIEVIPMEEDAE